MIRPTAAALVVATAALIAACGSSGNRDAAEDRREIRAAIAKLQTAVAEGDHHAACRALSRGARHHVGTLGHNPVDPCPRNMKDLVAQLAESQRSQRGAPRPEVTAIALDGDAAVATVRVSPRSVIRMPLVHQGGSWKVDALYGDIPGGDQQDAFS